MYEGNPREINLVRARVSARFESARVPVSEGSSYRESSVY